MAASARNIRIPQQRAIGADGSLHNRKHDHDRADPGHNQADGPSWHALGDGDPATAADQRQTHQPDDQPGKTSKEESQQQQHEKAARNQGHPGGRLLSARHAFRPFQVCLVGVHVCELIGIPCSGVGWSIIPVAGTGRSRRSGGSVVGGWRRGGSEASTSEVASATAATANSKAGSLIC
jgi:hypothetical protein